VAKIQFQRFPLILHSVLRYFIREPIIYFRKASFSSHVDETENGRCWVCMHAGTLSNRVERLRPESVTNVSSGRVINDQCCIWVSFIDCNSPNWADLLFPASAFDSGEFFFRHPVPSGEIACHATTVSPIIDRLSVSVGVKIETDLQ
jgi:hypothetical protein